MMHLAERLHRSVEHAELMPRSGSVVRVSGLLVEAAALKTSMGDLCTLHPPGEPPLRAEVVGFNQGRALLMPYADCKGVGMGCTVRREQGDPGIPVGHALLGRVIDAFGEPLDGKPAPVATERQALRGAPLNPLQRPRIQAALETGVRAIDSFLTIGCGQRVGIFAGSGVGKSTLLGMVARNMRADVNVIALIGERGREVREFIERSLGPAGLARSVVVAATSDQPAPVRIRAAYAATAIAEHFRDQGRDVMLTMDSVTRYAMARREIGLSVGEPPTSRGYTPSVFAELPRLMERCGTSDSGGSITALYTVLVEGDDLNDPISDACRSILDGHIVLSRQLATHGHYPAIDVLRSVSRLAHDLSTPAEIELVKTALALMSAHDKNQQMVEIGAYRAGTNTMLDRAIKLVPELDKFLRQDAAGSTRRADAMAALKSILAGQPARL
jgi:flagellum-specific ATP synthase